MRRRTCAAFGSARLFDDVAGPTAGWLSEKGDRLAATRRKVAADTEQYVSAHPWKSLGFALAAGFLISRFIR